MPTAQPIVEAEDNSVDEGLIDSQPEQGQLLRPRWTAARVLGAIAAVVGILAVANASFGHEPVSSAHGLDRSHAAVGSVVGLAAKKARSDEDAEEAESDDDAASSSDDVEDLLSDLYKEVDVMRENTETFREIVRSLPTNYTLCGALVCPKDNTCCGAALGGMCCGQTATCCGSWRTPGAQICCGEDSKCHNGICCRKDAQMCGALCCENNATCCKGDTGAEVCCQSGSTCCGGVCLHPGAQCANGVILP